MRTRTTVVLLVLAATVSGCAAAGGTGSPGTPTASAQPSEDDPAGGAATASVPASQLAGEGEAADACSLLGAGEIADVVGHAVEDGAGMTRSDCSWASDPDQTSVALLLTSTGTQEICASALDSDDAFQALDGFDVPAFWTWVSASGGVGSVSLCDAGQMITVSLSAGLDDVADEALVRSHAVQLAEVVLGRA